MNRLYITSYDGRIFFAEPNSTSFELLEYSNENENAQKPKVKKLSSCDWCLWTVSTQFKLCLFVFKLDTPYEHQEVTFENQRRYNLFSSEAFTNKLLKTDRYNFSSMDGTQNLPKENFLLPSVSWEWKTEWLHFQNSSNGWEYAIDFPAQYYPKFFALACVRRRKWTRVRTFKTYDQFINIPGPNKNDCIIDVAIGGWSIPYCKNGHLSVWIITSNGKLYYRNSVSHSNPEGTEWLKVPLPANTHAFSCSCSPTGQLCITTDQGEALLRSGISRQTPWGSNWLHIQAPITNCLLKQICASKNCIWALDNQGNTYYRAGINEKCIQGTKWVFIQASMLNISLSSVNQLWGINASDNSLYLRDGIDDENTSGISWKKINLKFKLIHRISANDCNEFDNYSNQINFSVSNCEPKTRNESNASSLYSINSIKNNENAETGAPTPKYIEFSIYDDFSIDQNEKTNLNEETKTNGQVLENNRSSEINLDEYLNQDFDTIMKISENVNKELDDILENLITNSSNSNEASFSNANQSVESEQKERRSDSSLSAKSSSSIESLGLGILGHKENDCVSLKSSSSPNSFYSDKEFIDLDLHLCSAQAFSMSSSTILPSWFEKNNSNKSQLFDSYSESNVHNEWRICLLNQLIKRNLREHRNIDRISVEYENDARFFFRAIFLQSFEFLTNLFKFRLEKIRQNSKKKLIFFFCLTNFKSNWSRIEEFSFYYNRKSSNCTLEIFHARKFNVLSKRFEKTFDASLVIKCKQNFKNLLQLTLDFKSIVLATRYIMPNKETTPSFALYVLNQSEPYIFFSSSEAKVNEWLNQITFYYTKYSTIELLNEALTFVNVHGYAYYAFIEYDKHEIPVYMTQLDGHFKYVEKHGPSGLTLGLGENGSFWFILNESNKLKESYKGPFIQTDELEIHTFENQRWNVLTGVMGIKNGFSSFGFPTDRSPWSDETGRIRRRKDECTLPSYFFKWSSNWMIDYSLKPGVDQEGWQYAFDFPASYHAVRNPLKDFVRRRRWTRKCRTKMCGQWQPLQQTHTLTSFSIYQDFLIDNKVLVWATDSNGFVLTTILDCSSLNSSIKWHNISSEESFSYVSVGAGLKIWALDSNGYVFMRYGLDLKSNNLRGTTWSKVRFNENVDSEAGGDEKKFKQISVGKDCVWAVSVQDELFFRENITKSFPEGTKWIKIDEMIKFVSVNEKNQMMAITNGFCKLPNAPVLRKGVSEKNLKGRNWTKIFPMEFKTLSNRGT